MFNIDYVEPNANCTVFCTDALAAAGLTDDELKRKAEELQNPGDRVLLRRLNYERYGDVEIYLEYERVKGNPHTKNREKTYRFIKKSYALCTFTSCSEVIRFYDK